MSDLAVKLFMADNGLDNFDVAQTIMYRHGLAESYETMAERLELLTEKDDHALFLEGAEAMHTVFKSIRFNMPPESRDTEFSRGILFAMDSVNAVLSAAVDHAGVDKTEEPDPIEGLLHAIIKEALGEPPSR